MSSEEEPKRQGASEERVEGLPPTTTAATTNPLAGLVSTAPPQMPSSPQTIAANANSGMGQVFDHLLRNPESSTELQIPEKLKKNSTLHASIRRNIYLTKKVKTRAEDDGIFCSCSPTTSASVCGGDCLCGMLLSCCTQTCKCGPSCLNKPFQQRPIRKMKLIETKKCGSGIIADEDIKQGEFVIEYVGEVIDDKMCEERLWKMKHTGEKNFYLCEINRDMVIDATYKGNKSRYINHSCQPNTEMQKWIIDGETRIGIFAIHDIAKGDELTYDYQFVQFGADQECHCGAATCRGKLGSKPPKDLRDRNACAGSSHLAHKQGERYPNCIGVLLRIWCPQAKRNYGGVIMDFDNLTKKHMILNEEGQFENLDLSKEEWDFL